MTLNTNLTANELKAAMILVTSCLDGMGGSRPADLGGDEYTWVSAKDLMSEGYSAKEAAGTIGALMEKGFVFEYDKNELVLATEAWEWLDTKWDEYQAAPSQEQEAEQTEQGQTALTVGQLIKEVWKPGKIKMPVYFNGGIAYIIVEKADLEANLREYPLDRIAPWQFLAREEGDDYRFLDSRSDGE